MERNVPYRKWIAWEEVNCIERDVFGKRCMCIREYYGIPSCTIGGVSCDGTQEGKDLQPSPMPILLKWSWTHGDMK